MILQLYRLSWCLCHDTIIIMIVTLNDKMQNLLILHEQRHTKIEQNNSSIQ